MRATSLIIREMQIKTTMRDFLCGPVVKDPPANAGDMGSIPGQGTKLPHTIGQLSPHSSKYRAHTLWSPHATTREKPKRHKGRSRVP